MSNAPAVSVVLCAYNGQRYLAESLRSILDQTFRDFECVVVDDGSTDRTPAILRQFAKSDSRVRVVRIPHAGIVDAVNAGLTEARAELIARADADDVCEPERFEKQVRFLADHRECVGVGSRMVLIDPFGAVVGRSDHKLEHEAIDAELLLGNGWALPQPVAMLRRDAVARVGGYDKRFEWVEDLDLFLRLAEVGRLANLPDYLCRYRIHPHSTNQGRYQLQVRLVREAADAARARRGLPPIMEWKNPLVERLPAEEQYRDWAWKALRARDVRAARRNAMQAVKTSPLDWRSWKVALCAVRGF